MAYRLLRRDTTNARAGVKHKRIQRLWREEGLHRPVRARKRRRVKPDTVERLRAERPNHLWALDFQLAETTDRRRPKSLHVVVESFNGRARDELFNIEEFATLLEVQVVVEAWRIEYNTYRPHSSLGDMNPAEYAASWTSTNPPGLSWRLDHIKGSRQQHPAGRRGSHSGRQSGNPYDAEAGGCTQRNDQPRG